MAHELNREEYLALHTPPLLPPIPNLDWRAVSTACGPNSPYPEIRWFYQRGGNVDITQEPGSALRTVRVDYHLQGRELHTMFAMEVTPDYFFQKLWEDMRAMLRYPDNYGPAQGGYVHLTGEMNESWGPSPLQLDQEASERRRQAWNENIATYAGDAIYRTDGIPDNQSEAHIRAKQWLLEHLTDEQRADFEKTNCFTVKGQSGKSYRINTTQRQMNIRLMPEDSSSEYSARNLCVVCKDKTVPILDQVLMQKLMIETKEDEFLELAGVSGGRRGLELEARSRQLYQQYQREMQDAQRRYTDAVRALKQEMQQAGNEVDRFNFNYRNSFGFAGPMP